MIAGIFLAALFIPSITSAQQPDTHQVTVMAGQPLCENDPACQGNCSMETACGKYYQKYCDLFDVRDWELYKYKLFLDRFNQKSCRKGSELGEGKCRVRDEMTEAVSPDSLPLNSMSRLDWYYAYRYRERQMDKEPAWRGIYEAHLAERTTYLRGYETARKIYGILIADPISPREIDRELDQPASFLLPSDQARAKLTLRDLIYIYLGEDALVSLKKKETDQKLKHPSKELKDNLRQADAKARAEIGKLLHDHSPESPAPEDHSFLLPKTP